MVNFGMSQVSGRIKNRVSLNEKEKKKNNYSETLTSSGNS